MKVLASLFFKAHHRILDFGCGRGRDVEWLRGRGYQADGWDPYEPFGHSGPPSNGPYDFVTCIYVLNVLPSLEERRVAQEEAWDQVAVGGHLFIVTRQKRDIDDEAKKKGWPVHGDGYLSRPNTFQRGFWPEDVRDMSRFLPGSKPLILWGPHQHKYVLVQVTKER